VWPMVRFEADDAIAAGARVAADDPRVSRVWVCSPDKDLAQCVRGDRVVQLDRRGAGTQRDEDGVVAKFGVPPALIPDWLALVGDAADGYPGVPGFGARGAAAVLTALGHVRDIPDDPAAWAGAGVRGHVRLANTLAGMRDRAMLFVRLATLCEDVPVMPGGVDDIRWTAPRDDIGAVCAAIGADDVPGRLAALAATRA
jgi:5'-3' exonuclease